MLTTVSFAVGCQANPTSKINELSFLDAANSKKNTADLNVVEDKDYDNDGVPTRHRVTCRDTPHPPPVSHFAPPLPSPPFLLFCIRARPCRFVSASPNVAISRFPWLAGIFEKWGLAIFQDNDGSASPNRVLFVRDPTNTQAPFVAFDRKIEAEAGSKASKTQLLSCLPPASHP